MIKKLKNLLSLFILALQGRITPKNITYIKDNEVFVFGSNVRGEHAGGAAKLAYILFGAVWGEGEGLFGWSYAFPTLGMQYNKYSLSTLRKSVTKLKNTIEVNKDKKFYITAVGTGIAGYTVEEVAPLFKPVMDYKNVTLPKEFWEILLD